MMNKTFSKIRLNSQCCKWIPFFFSINWLYIRERFFVFYPHTLTLALTTETPINRAFQAYCEGVRVTK